MSRARQVVGLVVAAAALWVAAPAQATAASYTLQVAGRSSNNKLELDGGRITTFAVDVSPQSCSGTTWQDDSDAVWAIALSSGQSVPVTNGHFSFDGQAPAAFYPAGSGTADYTVSGKVSSASGPGAAARRVVQGTISFTNGSAPSVSGCSGSSTFLAIPTPTRTAVVGSPGSSDFTSQFMSFNYRHNTVKNLVVQANFECGTGPDPSVDSAPVDAAAYGYRSLRTQGGRFSLHAYVLDEYQDIISVNLTGRIHGRSANGRIKVGEPAGLVGVANSACSGNSTWTASRPMPPAPAALFSWAAVRVPTGSSYRYYFYVTNLTCQNGANTLIVTVKGRRTKIRCSAGQGWASGPLAPGRDYSITTQAVKTRHAKVVGRGLQSQSNEQMPAADSPWQPIGPLPTQPPA